LFESHSAGNVSKEGESVWVASFPDDCRRPESRPHFDHGEDPDWLFFAPDDRLDFVCLKFYNREPIYLLIVEATTPDGCSFKPPMNRIPADSLDSSDGRLIEAFDTEGGDFIKECGPMLESIIGCPGGRAKGPSTSPALVATTLPRPSPVETVANDRSGTGIFRGRTVPVGTGEILHGFGTLSTVELVVWN
jgi:hypothetical protein